MSQLRQYLNSSIVNERVVNNLLRKYSDASFSSSEQSLSDPEEKESPKPKVRPIPKPVVFTFDIPGLESSSSCLDPDSSCIVVDSDNDPSSVNSPTQSINASIHSLSDTDKPRLSCYEQGPEEVIPSFGNTPIDMHGKVEPIPLERDSLSEDENYGRLSLYDIVSVAICTYP